jgi:hypothetical protein
MFVVGAVFVVVVVSGSGLNPGGGRGSNLGGGRSGAELVWNAWMITAVAAVMTSDDEAVGIFSCSGNQVTVSAIRLAAISLAIPCGNQDA